MTDLDRNSLSPPAEDDGNNQRENCRRALTQPPASSLDDFYTDPDVMRRIGVLIATAARRSISAKY